MWHHGKMAQTVFILLFDCLKNIITDILFRALRNENSSPVGSLYTAFNESKLFGAFALYSEDFFSLFPEVESDG